ncbi:MBL fold hydrolase [Thalassotalea sp. 42_200_T64]|nr:MBL fold hydrolase [Thalassotalea sp. 42_200_T64]
MDISFNHHGAVNGVTGSCHQINIKLSNCPSTNGNAGNWPTTSYLIDCGLFQGAEITATTDNNDASAQQRHKANGKLNDSANDQHSINFPLDNICALLVTHCHIDHVGRIPYLLAAGFTGPIYCSAATAKLLPLVISDAVKVGVSRNKQIINAVVKRLKQQLVAVSYNRWKILPVSQDQSKQGLEVKVKFKAAGHILGSAYIELAIANKTTKRKHKVVFSGDLGASYTPLLPKPKAPYSCDTLIIESTYGDKNHHGRKQRRKNLEQVLKRCVDDNGVVLIPAFSIGRTQELLYEIEEILHRLHKKHNSTTAGSEQILNNIDVIVDSPLASEFTEHYRELKQHWDLEARCKLANNRHPLSFEQLYTVGSHQEHQSVISYLKQKQKPAIIIAASGMCTGGRMVNYLQSFLSDKTTDVLFVGYQAKGTLGRQIQQNKPRYKTPYVFINHNKVAINAGIHTLSGYSAHADQSDLLSFIKGMRKKPNNIRIVHGDSEAKSALQLKIKQLYPDIKVLVPH